MSRYIFLDTNIYLYYHVTPEEEFKTHGLRRERSDDSLIATILHFRDHVNSDVLLITNDTGPRLTALHLGLPTKPPPEEYRLPTSDPLEEDNLRLRRELDKLKQTLPDLRVTIGGEAGRVEAEITAPESFDEGAAAAELAKLRAAYSFRSPDPLDVFESVPKSEYYRYNSELAQYFTQYEEYLRESWTHAESDKWVIPLDFVLKNIGGAPAEDIDVNITFSANAHIFEFDPRGFSGRKPQLPVEPRPQAAIYIESLGPNYRPEQFSMPPIYDALASLHANVSKATIESEGDDHLIRWRVKHLKHDHHIDFKPLYLGFSSRQSARSFTLSWSAHAANRSEVMSGELHVVVRNRAAIHEK